MRYSTYGSTHYSHTNCSTRYNTHTHDIVFE